MIAVWMAYGIVVATLISGVALALDRGCSLLGWPRRWTWLMGMATSAMAPVGAVLAGRWTNFLPADPTLSTTPATFGALDSGLATTSWLDRAASFSHLDTPLLAVWISASVLILGGLLLAFWRMQREIIAWPSSTIDGIPVRVTPDIGPAVVGTFPSNIVIPKWLATLGDQDRNTVVRHEHEHLIRGDTRLLQAGLLIAAGVPWMLPLWWQFARMRDAIELDCDRRVLKAGISAPRYARLLLDLTGHVGRSLGPATTMADRPSILARRIMTMLNRKPPFTPARLLALATIAGVLGVAACETPVPPNAPLEVRPEAVMDTPPVRLSGPAPPYPEMLRRAGIEGHVVVGMIVKADGTVDSASVTVVESTNRAFEGPAIAVLRHSLFEPAVAGGTPVPASIEQRMRTVGLRRW